MKIRHFLLMTASVMALALSIPALKADAAPVTMADGTVFDAEFYASSYPDVVAVFGTNPDLLYMHYALCGKAEGRLAVSPSYVPTTTNTGSFDFDVVYYAGRYPDVATILGYDPALLKLHYDLYGKAEGRFPNAAAEAAAGSSAASVPASVTTNNIGAYEQQVLDLVNAERAKVGLAPLSWDASNLAPGAAVRAQEIVGYFSHTRPDGTSCFTAIRNPGRVGENIAAGQRTPQAVMNSWMNSSGHRANILNAGYTKIGVGYVYVPGSPYGAYWVQMFSS